MNQLKIDSIGSVEINNNHERANFDVNVNLPSSLLINGFFGMKFFYGSSALRASDPPKNFIPQKPFISNLEGKVPFTSKGSIMINIFTRIDTSRSDIGFTYKLTGYPSYIIFKDGNEVDRHVGPEVDTEMIEDKVLKQLGH